MDKTKWLWGVEGSIILLNNGAYSDVSIKNIEILPNWQYIANTADLAQEQYS